MSQIQTVLSALIDLQQEVYEGNKAKGFWEDAENRNKGEAIALINGELYEALEAHRKGRFALPNLLALVQDDESRLDATKQGVLAMTNHEDIKTFMEDHGIKDSVEDELADTVIRMLDFIGGFKIKLVFKELGPIVLPENFGVAILSISYDITTTFVNRHITKYKYLGLSLTSICKLSENLGIDLLWHVKAKLKYNATRPFKHGKKY